MATRLNNPASQFFDKATKAPLSGGQMFFFNPGSDTPKPTFSNSQGTIANTQPVILDGNGVIPDIFGDGSYRVVLRASPVATAILGVQQWERDPVTFETGSGGFSDWDEVTTYAVNGIVEAADGAFYVAIAPSTNANPTGGANAQFWSRFDLLNRWNPNETYVIAAVVRGSDGIVYTAVQGSLNVDPITDTDGSHWKMFDNIRIDGNTVSATDTNGNLNLNSNGSGSVLANGAAISLAPITTQTFTVGGVYTTPAGVKFIIAEGVGGGGGGGSSGAFVSASAGGQGGGSGGYFRDIIDVTAISSLAVTIGAGGAGGTPSPPDAGGSGTATTIIGGPTPLTAAGGGGGIRGFSSGLNNNGGGDSGVNPFRIKGSAGGWDAGIHSSFAGGTTGRITGGSGGGSQLGGDTAGPAVSGAGSFAGIAALGFGNGGSGGVASAGISNTAGGAGSNGFVIITEHR